MATRDAYEAMVDACVSACEELDVDDGTTPSEAALYNRITLRLVAAMHRAGMREPQMDIVVDEFLAAAKELAADAEATVAEHQRARHDAGLCDCPWRADAEPEPEPEEPQMVEIELTCGACRRSLGQALIPESIRPMVEPMKCPGCIREGR